MNGWAALQWWRYCRDHPDLDVTCCRLLGELIATHNARTGITFGGVDTLAAAARVSRGAVMRHLAHLRDGEHVQLVRRHPHGARLADEYTIRGSTNSLMVPQRNHEQPNLVVPKRDHERDHERDHNHQHYVLV